MTARMIGLHRQKGIHSRITPVEQGQGGFREANARRFGPDPIRYFVTRRGLIHPSPRSQRIERTLYTRRRSICRRPRVEDMEQVMSCNDARRTLDADRAPVRATRRKRVCRAPDLETAAARSSAERTGFEAAPNPAMNRSELRIPGTLSIRTS